tara:strand:+ start:1000 stop:1422 length:423 start_codon:yes stop_codon:yes gene_type:complete
MIITIASDHGGYITKEAIGKHLNKKGHVVKDVGCFDEESCDYPDYAKEACDLVASNEVDFGILVCGTGIGMSMAANRNPKIRAGLCKDIDTAMLTRAHNDANVLCLGARVTDSDFIEAIVDAFLNTQFEGGRHQKRIGKF